MYSKIEQNKLSILIIDMPVMRLAHSFIVVAWLCIVNDEEIKDED